MCTEEGIRCEGRWRSPEKPSVLEEPRNGFVERDDEAIDHCLSLTQQTNRESLERWVGEFGGFGFRKSLL